MLENAPEPYEETRDAIQKEVHRHLEPYAVSIPLSGETVIGQDLTIDSLAYADAIMELEDYFNISIPICLMVEIRTVGELIDQIMVQVQKRTSK